MQGEIQRVGSPEVQRSKLKEEAVAFYAQHNVTDALEALLNRMFLENPQDVYGYMSEYFHRLSLKPFISGVKGSYQFDTVGHPSIALTVLCRINGLDKTVCTYTHPIVEREEERKEQLMNTSAKPLQSKQKQNDPKQEETETKEGEDKSDKQSCPHVLECLEYFEERMKGISPDDQVAIDTMIEQSCSNYDAAPIHPSMRTALSCLAVKTSSVLTETPPYLRILESFDEHDTRLKVPIPVMSVVSGGQKGTGKSKVRCYLVSPSPTVDIAEGAKYVIDFYKEIGRQLSIKQGALGYATLPNGTYCMAADKPEQVLELLKESATQAGLELNREISVYIDIGADSLYDSDKKKYEIANGQWKTSAELITLYGSLLSSYPGLIGFIDPLHPKDLDGWTSLAEQLGDKCLLVTDSTCSELFNLETTEGETTDELPTQTEQPPTANDNGSLDSSLTFITCSTLCARDNLISHCYKDALKLKDHSHYLMLSLDYTQTVDSLKLLLELAVTLKCKFVRLCAPAGLGSLVALSHLVELHLDIKTRSLHRPSSALLYSCVKQDSTNCS